VLGTYNEKSALMIGIGIVLIRRATLGSNTVNRMNMLVDAVKTDIKPNCSTII